MMAIFGILVSSTTFGSVAGTGAGSAAGRGAGIEGRSCLVDSLGRGGAVEAGGFDGSAKLFF